MKKNLILTLALVFVLGIASTAFAAANPFVDVPAKHWAYDAVTKLAQAGILDGYGDGTYKGGNLATRYEMAQATAKAMARSDKADAANKALIDKLAVEFAAELNNLGVRVAKLEKNASSIKFSGDSRLRWQGNAGNWVTTDNSGQAVSKGAFRMRVNAVAQVNDNVTFNARLYAEPYFSQPNYVVDKAGNQLGADTNYPIIWEIWNFKWAINPTTYFLIGRNAPVVGDGMIYGTTGLFDGVEMGFNQGQPFSVTIGYGDISGKTANTYAAMGNNAVTKTTGAQPAYVGYLDARYKPNANWLFYGSMWWSMSNDNTIISGNQVVSSKTLPTSGSALYTAGTDYANTTYSGGYPFQLWGFGFDGQITKDFNLRGIYVANSSNKVAAYYPSDNHDAWALQLRYMFADYKKPGTWDFLVNYRDIKPFGMDPYIFSNIFGNEVQANSSYGLAGYKGYGFQVDYAAAKNLVVSLSYFGLSQNSNGFSAQYAPQYYLQTNWWF